MAESPVPITPGTGGASIASDLVSGNNYQQIKVVDATIGSSNAWQVNSDGSAQTSVIGTVRVSIVGTVPVNIVAGGSTGSVATNVQGSVATVIIGGSIAASFTPPANQSISGTVGASIIGTISATIVGGSSVNAAVSGSVVAFQGTSPWIITGSVQGSFSPSGNQSISGTVGASIVGQVPSGTAMIGSVVSYQGVIPWTIGSVYGNISGSVFAVVSGLQGASVSGTLGVSIVGAAPMIPAVYITSTQGITSVMTGTSSVLVLAAPGSGKNYITHVLVTNGGAVSTTVTIQDGASVLWGGYAAASGGGWSENFNPPLPQPTSLKALYVTSSVQSSVIVAINGFTGA